MRIAAYLFAALLIGLTAPRTYANSIVVPNFDATVVANDDSGSLAGSPPSLEVQDDYDSAQFSSAGGPILITGFAWRMKPGTGSITVTDTSGSMYLSTTQYAANTSSGHPLLTTNLATNRGPDNTLVYSAGPGTLWSSTGCGGPGPCPFDVVFTFSTPFLYNPSQGNLLVDLQATGLVGTGAGEFDVASYNADPA
ncbi:MAG: hypothetical protein ACRD2G_04570, partial [Terriglobia bacterium]